MADEAIASGKSKYEIAYLLTKDLLDAKDGPKNNYTRSELIQHYVAARYPRQVLGTQALVLGHSYRTPVNTYP